MLPEEFLDRMKRMLGPEYEDFLRSYEREKYQALRLNPLKEGSQRFLEEEAFAAGASGKYRPVPWCEDGFYYGSDLRPGKHPYHEAGVYYIQEPSAMAPAEYLDVRPGMRVLDLCAAPGGKSTQIAGKMQGRGILVSNEIHPARARILSENIERMGIKNAIVVNETPQKLEEVFVAYFDRIMVDAPCSGEGMFRKNDEAAGEWSAENVKMCARRQDEILEAAYGMLAPGGRMVYSTCTFAPEEDEGSMARFLKAHEDMRLLPAERFAGMEEGKPEWIYMSAAEESWEEREGVETEPGRKEREEQLRYAIRLWPHKLSGEGHFVAVLKKEERGRDGQGYCKNGEEKGLSAKESRKYIPLLQEFLKDISADHFIAFGDQLYLLPEKSPCLKGLKVLRPGLHLGTMKKNRMEPAHALALACGQKDARYTADLTEQEAVFYIRGETFPWKGEKGWYLITVNGYPLGWGKLAGGMMKNHYPKGLRRTDLEAGS